MMSKTTCSQTKPYFLPGHCMLNMVFFFLHKYENYSGNYKNGLFFSYFLIPNLLVILKRCLCSECCLLYFKLCILTFWAISKRTFLKFLYKVLKYEYLYFMNIIWKDNLFWIFEQNFKSRPLFGKWKKWKGKQKETKSARKKDSGIKTGSLL